MIEQTNEAPQSETNIVVPKIEEKTESAAPPALGMHRHRDTFGQDGDFNFQIEGCPQPT